MVAVAMSLVGIVALTLGFTDTSGPPQPVAAAPRSVTTSEPSSTSTAPGAPVTPPKPAASATAATKNPTSAESTTRFGQFLSASAPTVLDIPSIGVRSTNFVDLQVAEDGTLDVPGSADEVGIYAEGPTPGQLGPAVLGAHVDSTKGPGIFYSLGAVKPGAKIHITRQDKVRTTFVVDEVKLYPKDDFPTDKVYYGDFNRSEIRLVTCGGIFDPVKHYLGNVVVSGHLVSAEKA